MDFMLSRATRVTAQWASAPVQHAVARFWRDMEMTLSTTGFVPDNRLMICLAPALPPESYTLDVTENQLTLCAADDSGAVYGLLDISRHYLGVAPFWFWNSSSLSPNPLSLCRRAALPGQPPLSACAGGIFRMHHGCPPGRMPPKTAGR